MSTKPTQGWRCKTCGKEGEVPGTMNTRADILLNRIVSAHRQAAPSCQATEGGQVGYDQYGWYVSAIPHQTPHCEAKRDARATVH